MKIKSHSDVGNIQAMKDAQIGATGEYRPFILEPQILDRNTTTSSTVTAEKLGTQMRLK